MAGAQQSHCRTCARAGRPHLENPVNPTRLVAILLIVAGALALAYGGFSYTKDSTAVKLGPLELTVKEKETVNVPLWAGIGAIVVGAALLLAGSRKG
jgi:uncharacterized membrane protein YidH (DUF202 family)